MKPETEFCPQCAEKHLGRAMIRLSEFRTGRYPAEYWFAMAEMSLAQDHLQRDRPALAAVIDAERKRLETDPEYRPNFDNLVVELSEQCGYSVSGYFKGGLVQKFNKFLKTWLPAFFVVAAISTQAGGIRIESAPIDQTARSSITVVSNLLGNYATPGNVSNILSGIIPTSTVTYAASAGNLVIPGGWGSFAVTGDPAVLVISTWTNTANVIVTATNGVGYNGPAVGAVLTYAAIGAPYPDYGWRAEGDAFIAYLAANVGYISIGTEQTDLWTCNDGIIGAYESVQGAAAGTLSLAYAQSTNTTSAPLADYLLKSTGITTNRIIEVGDILSFTNGQLGGISHP